MSRSDYVYRNATPYARAVQITQGLYLAAVMVNLIVVAVIVITHDPISQFASLSDLAVSLGYIVAAITFAVWTWRVVANANTFKPTMNAKPWWAIGWYIVPVASLWKPYQYLEETWDASCVATSRDPAPLLRWWWGLWIAMLIVGSIGNAFARVEQQAGEVSVGTLVSVVGVALRVPLCIIVIRLVGRLAQLQAAKRKGGGAAEVFA